MCKDWKIGQDVWVVPNDPRSKPYSATIGKIGRKWVTMDPEWKGRFDRATGEVDGGRNYAPTGVVWDGKDAHDAYLDVCAAWKVFRDQITYEPPKHLTVDVIDDMLRILKAYHNPLATANPPRLPNVHPSAP